jgi:hypothetical protein
MADCSENHAECPDPRPGKPVMLPTRLIEISALGKPESACLRDTSGRKGYYCALSYCWGVNQPFKTTLDRYEEYFRRLPYAQLPRTITDSFQVARSLGLEYIWIDSLCIIQDDQEDVNREIKEMLHVYQNAMVTISVASPSQCGEGFLYKRHKIYKSPDGPFRLPIRVDRGMMGSVFLSGFTTAWECAMEPKNKTSINYRGWTLQESALSPRLLLLTNTNMVWKCPHGFQPDLRPVPPRAREYHTKDWSRDARWKLWATKIGYEFMPHPSAIALSQPPGSESLVSAGSKVRAGWILLIENYTARELGKETDRLPAISGIAELFAPYLGGREGYRAGLWKESLVLDLGWYTPERFFTESRVTDPRVPSWSWAAAKGQVRFPEGAGLTANARLIECRTKLVSDEAPFGAVSEGQLHINGVVVQVWVDVRQTKLRDKEGKLANFDIDEGRGQWIASHGYGVTVEARCLMLATKSSLRANETIKQKETFGILLAASESHLGRYRRIGWVDFEIHDSPLWWEKLERTTITIV